MTFVLRNSVRSWKLLARFALFIVVSSNCMSWCNQINWYLFVFRNWEMRRGKSLVCKLRVAQRTAMWKWPMQRYTPLSILFIQIICLSIQSFKKLFCYVFVCRRHQMRVENHPPLPNRKVLYLRHLLLGWLFVCPCSSLMRLFCCYNTGASSSEKGTHMTGIYDLVSVLTHKGRSADSGHYVAWVKQESG